MLFTQFLDEIYLPVSLPKLAASTQNRTRGVIANYLRPRFGETRIAAITVLDVDRFLASLATRDLTQESLDKIRDVLSGVFSAAVRYGYLAGTQPVGCVCHGRNCGAHTARGSRPPSSPPSSRRWPRWPSPTPPWCTPPPGPGSG